MLERDLRFSGLAAVWGASIAAQPRGAIVARMGQDRWEPGLVERSLKGLRGAERGLGPPEDPPCSDQTGCAATLKREFTAVIR